MTSSKSILQDKNGLAARRQSSLVFISFLCFAGAFSLLISIFIPPDIQWFVFLGIVLLFGVFLVALRYPEITFALFLYAGAYKQVGFLNSFSGIFDMTVLLGLVSGIGIIQKVFRKKMTVNFQVNVVMPWFALCILMIMSLFWTGSFDYGLYKTSKFVTISSFALLSPFLLFKDNLTAISRFFFTLGSATLLFSCITLWFKFEQLGNYFVFLEGTSYLNFGRFVGGGFIIALLYMLPSRHFGRLFGVITVLFTGSAWIFSSARGPFVSMIVTIGLVLVVNLIIPNKKQVYSYFWPIVFCISVLIAAFFLGLLPKFLIDRINPEVILENARLNMFHRGIEAITVHPVIGLGIGGFSHWFVNEDTRMYPHNLLIEVGAEMGLSGLMIVIYLLFTPIIVFLGSLKNRQSSIMWQFQITTFALFIFTFVNALFTEDITGNHPVWTFAGLLTVLCKQKNNELTFRS